LCAKGVVSNLSGFMSLHRSPSFCQQLPNTA